MYRFLMGGMRQPIADERDSKRPGNVVLHDARHVTKLTARRDRQA